MDKLKQYLKQHEAGMQADTPGEEVWKHIRERSSARGKLVSFARRYVAAASILLMVGAGIIVWITSYKKNTKPVETALQGNKKNKDSLQQSKRIADTVNHTELVQVMPSIDPANRNSPIPIKTIKKTSSKDNAAENEIALIGEGYTKLIALQMKKLRTTPVYAGGPGYFSQFATGLKQMETDEARLKRDIKTYGFNDQLLDQLINIYQQKLNLLKSLQAEINKMNNRTREKEHPSSKPEPYFINL